MPEMFDEAYVQIKNSEKQTTASSRQRVNHIPFCDVDDLAFKNRHDPAFIANISERRGNETLFHHRLLILNHLS